MTQRSDGRGPRADAVAHRLAKAVRDACVHAALDGHELAGLSGLCAEGRWEAAVDAMRSLDLDSVVMEITEDLSPPQS
ncbi:MAG: acetyltransferase [Candidatus Dormiibacterota bacterium]